MKNLLHNFLLDVKEEIQSLTLGQVLYEIWDLIKSVSTALWWIAVYLYITS